MFWKWVSFRMYTAVLATKDEVIAELRARVESLEHRLDNPAPVNVKVDFPSRPAISTAPRNKRPVAQPDKTVDWATIDPNDNMTMARIAAQEYGRRVSPMELANFVARVKQNIRTARVAKESDEAREALISSAVPPSVHIEDPDDGIEDPYVPEHIRRQIEEAERVN